MRRRHWTRGAALALAAVLAFVQFGVMAAVAAPNRSLNDAVVSPPLGLAKPHPTGRAPIADATAQVGTMTYHGGPVMHHVTAYAVYWQPPGTYMSPNYKTLINRYFRDVGATTNYSVVQQYTDPSGPPGLDVTFGGAWTDTTPFPNGEGSQANPVTEQQLLTYAVSDALNANPTWADDVGHEIFVYLPKGIYLGNGSVSFVDFCAFHFAYVLPGEAVATHPVAAMPYVATNPNACSAFHNGALAAPNGDSDADSEINTTSHEFMESVTDPGYNATQASGWYWQDQGHENGDMCNFVFGPFDAQGGDVVLNGNEYVVQTEWSNKSTSPTNPTVSTGCIMTTPMAGSVALASSANPAQPGQPVTFTATVLPNPVTRATGTMQFRDGPTLVGALFMAGGAASWTTSSLAEGSHTITVTYSGDASYLPATSTQLTQVVKLQLLTYPSDGQANINTTVPFTWYGVPGAQAFALIIGTARYGSDVVNSGLLAPGQTWFNEPALPVGQTLYATLLIAINGAWDSQSITFTAAPGVAAFSYPVNNQVNVDPATKQFTWATIPGAQQYLLLVGSTPFGYDAAAALLPPTQASYTMAAVPAGRTSYATLFTEVFGVWSRYQTVTFTTSGTATFTYPVNGQSAVSRATPFGWATVAGAQQYLLLVGTTAFGYDTLAVALPPSASSYPMTAVPAGRVSYATLFTEVGGVWTRYQTITFIT